MAASPVLSSLPFPRTSLTPNDDTENMIRRINNVTTLSHCFCVGPEKGKVQFFALSVVAILLWTALEMPDTERAMPQPPTLFNDDPDDESTPARSFQDRVRPPPRLLTLNPEKELVKLFEQLAYRHDKWRVFADFCEMAATALSNKVDPTHYDKREARYMQIVKAYDRSEVELFPQALNHVIMALEDDMTDMLGRVFHALELHNKYAGQFFTPDTVCQMMAAMTVGDGAEIRARIARRGFVTAAEPAVGSGAMVIALAKAMKDAGINYQQHLHVTAVDKDPKCAHMAYVQFALLHIPAVVIHGDSLALKEYDHWYTPAHVMGGWVERLRHMRMLDRMKELLTAPPIAVVHAPADTSTESQGEEPEISLPFRPGPQMSLF